MMHAQTSLLNATIGAVQQYVTPHLGHGWLRVNGAQMAHPPLPAIFHPFDSQGHEEFITRPACKSSRRSVMVLLGTHDMNRTIHKP